jgi:hypothetical protein
LIQLCCHVPFPIMEAVALWHLISSCLGVEEEVQFQEVLVLEVVGAGVQGLSFLSSEELAVGLEEFFY